MLIQVWEIMVSIDGAPNSKLMLKLQPIRCHPQTPLLTASVALSKLCTESLLSCYVTLPFKGTSILQAMAAPH